eukprot:gene10599-12333_t
MSDEDFEFPPDDDLLALFEGVDNSNTTPVRVVQPPTPPSVVKAPAIRLSLPLKPPSQTTTLSPQSTKNFQKKARVGDDQDDDMWFTDEVVTSSPLAIDSVTNTNIDETEYTDEPTSSCQETTFKSNIGDETESSSAGSGGGSVKDEDTRVFVKQRQNKTPIKSYNYETVTLSTLGVPDDGKAELGGAFNTFQHHGRLSTPSGQRIQTNKIVVPPGYKEVNSKFTLDDLAAAIDIRRDSLVHVNFGLMFDNDETNFRSHITNEDKRKEQTKAKNLEKNKEKTSTKRKSSDGDSPAASVCNVINEALSVSLWVLSLNGDFDSSEVIVEKYHISFVNHDGVTLKAKLDYMVGLLEDDMIKKVCYNAQEALKPFIQHYQWLQPRDLHDPRIAAWLLNSEGKPYDMPSLAFKYVENSTTKLSRSIRKEDKFTMDTTNESLTNYYACFSNDIKNSSIMMLDIQDKLESPNIKMTTPAGSEMRVIPILAKMEIGGVTFNPEILKPCQKIVNEYLDRMIAKVLELFGEELPINSPIKIRPKLEQLIKNEEDEANNAGNPIPRVTLKSTGKPELVKLIQKRPDHPSGLLAKMIIEYRHVAKVISTYVEPYIVNANNCRPDDIKIKNSWLHTGTATGRLSAQFPEDEDEDSFLDDDETTVRPNINLNIRDAFQARDGYVLLALDYNQVELRTMAHFSQDTLLIKFFKSGVDVLRLMAGHWLGKDASQVTDIERDRTKRIVYGIMYGMGVDSLATILNVEKDQANSFKNGFLDKFRGIKDLMSKTLVEAQKQEYVTTFNQRRRHLQDINSTDSRISHRAKRQAVNSIIQGSASDFIKLAMVDVENLLRDESVNSPVARCANDPRLVLQIHDELIYEIPKEMIYNKPDLCDKIKYKMENVVQGDLDVPLSVSMSIGSSWGSLVPYQDQHDLWSLSYRAEGNKVIFECLCPVGSRRDYDIAVSIDGVLYPSPGKFNYVRPSISATTIDHKKGRITLGGQSFGDIASLTLCNKTIDVIYNNHNTIITQTNSFISNHCTLQVNVSGQLTSTYIVTQPDVVAAVVQSFANAVAHFRVEGYYLFQATSITIGPFICEVTSTSTSPTRPSVLCTASTESEPKGNYTVSLISGGIASNIVTLDEKVTNSFYQRPWSTIIFRPQSQRTKLQQDCPPASANQLQNAVDP